MSVQRVAIRKQLLRLFVPGFCGLWILSAVLSFWFVDNYSHEFFDKDLTNSADSVAARIRFRNGKLVVDLPAAAIAMLKQTEADGFYYRVIDDKGKRISGDANMPPPLPDATPETPLLTDGMLHGKAVRVVQITVPLDEPVEQKLIVQAAETLNTRATFQRKMLLCIALPQLFVLGIALFAVLYGVKRILTPLRTLQLQLSRRAEADLSPLSDRLVPEEVSPLVEAMNRLFAQLKNDIDARQRFIANAAHQLRTPLAGLKTYSSMAVDMTDPAELQHVIHRLDQGIDRSSRMVAQLLTLARGENPDALCAIDLDLFLQELISSVSKLAEARKIHVVFDCNAGSATIYGAEPALYDLFSNILENAILYSPEGATIAINLLQRNQHLEVRVTDEGPGIPLDERSNVFDRFYRIPGTPGEGSGLGLAIAYEAAVAMHAEISIEEAKPTPGTVLVVRFPIPHAIHLETKSQ